MEINLSNRFFNFNLSLGGAARDRVPVQVQQKSSEWSQVFIRALHSNYGENRLLKPYEQYPWVYIAIRKIAISISQVPFQIFKGKETLVESGPLYWLFNHPNPMTSRFQLWEGIVTLLYLDGNAFEVFWSSTGGRFPDQIWVFGKDKVTPLKDGNSGQVVGYRLKDNDGYVNLDAREVIHYKFYNPYDSTMGLSPVTVARITAESDYSAMRYNKSVMENNAEPSGVLAPRDKDIVLTDDQIKMLRDQFEDRHKGVDNAKRLAVLPGALDYKQIAMSNKDMEFLEARRYNREEILGIFGVPKGVVGISDDLNYATLFGQKRIFWQDTCLPLIKMIEDAHEAQFFPIYAKDHWGKFDRKSVPELQEDFASKVDSAFKLNQMGFPINAINDRLDLGFDTIPWGDTVLVPMSMIPVDMAGEFQPPANGGNDGNGERRIALPLVKVAKPEELRLKRWTAFLNLVDPIERKFASKLQRFFFEQRKAIIELLYKNTKDVGDYQSFFSWDDEDKKLVSISMSYYRDAIKNGSSLVADIIGEGVFDITNPLAIQAIERRCNRITRCNDTIKRRIANQLQDGMVHGDSIAGLADRIKQEYNIARARAMTIARTEISGATNEGEQLAMEDAGVERQQWLTAGDEAVRSSHESANGQIVKLNEPFVLISANGMRTEVNYPGDPQCDNAAEIINCRCTTVPIV